MILVNGQSSDRLPVSDRGLQYGDGLFETMLIQQGRIAFWKAHLDRLSQGCKRLNIPLPERQVLEAEIDTLLKGNNQPAVLKLIVTRGSGGRGYLPPTNVTPTRILSLHPVPQHPEANQSTGVKVHLCETRLGQNPRLAGIKHLNRLEQVLARSEWQDESIAEGVMLDTQGHLIEGTMSNIFWINNGRLCTPSVQFCGVAGVIRGQIIHLSDKLSLQLDIQQFSLDDLLQSEAAFLCNSVIGIWPVKEFQTTHWAPHPMIKTIREELSLVA